MKKSYLKLIIFDILLLVFLILSSFILNILRNYYYMDIFLIGLLIAFKFIFGFEKDRHRFVKDIIINILAPLRTCSAISRIRGVPSSSFFIWRKKYKAMPRAISDATGTIQNTLKIFSIKTVVVNCLNFETQN